jgi:hypothetical protein
MMEANHERRKRIEEEERHAFKPMVFSSEKQQNRERSYYFRGSDSLPCVCGSRQ